ncbi:MAG: TonB-dependent receptor [Kiritimatiellae bacterium]|nr:TonB-dependent receptor [Kiritimatiellia bacterium]
MKAVFTILVLSICVSTLAAYAAGPKPAEPDVVVTATRQAAETGKLAANVTVVTGEQIVAAGHETVVDALENLEGVLFRSFSGNASQAEIGMRGFGENSHGRVLVLLDGRRMNRPDMAGINWLQLPISHIERIEVVRGGNSVLYGDHAVGGVVNIITKKGTPEPRYFVSLLGGSFGMNAQSAGLSGATGPLYYTVNLARDATAGYRDRTAYSAWGGGADLLLDVGETTHASVGLSYNALEYEIPGYLTKAQMEDDPTQSVTPDDGAQNTYVNVDLGVRALFGEACALDVNIGFGRKDIESDMASWFSYADLLLDTYSVAPKLTLKPAPNMTLLAGVDCAYDAADVKRYMDEARSFATVSADLSRSTLGGYLRGELGVGETWILAAGGRLESAVTDASMTGVFDDEITHDVNAVDVSATWLPCEKGKVFAKAATVYRYPFLDEQVSYVGFGTDQIYQDIDPERGVSVEAGVAVRNDPNADAGLTVFVLDMEDEIAFNATTYQNENLDETRRVGVEARAGYRISEICGVSANYTYTDATFTSGPNDGNHVPLVPAHKVTAAVDVRLPPAITLGAEVSHVSESYLGGDTANTGEKLDAYTVVGLSARYAPKQIAGLQVFVGVDNLLDEAYATAGYQGGSGDGYYPAPERSYRAGCRYRF